MWIDQLTMEASTAPIKYTEYARKSSEQDEKQVQSIPDQIRDIRSMINRDGLHSIQLLQESHSAKLSGERAVFNQMVSDIKAGKANGIIAWSPDRLSRNASDAGTLIDLMDRGFLVEIRTMQHTFENNPTEKFLFSMMCSQAKLENDHKGEAVKRGLRTRREQGIFPAVAPPGYTNVGEIRGGRTIAPDPQRFKLIQRARHLVRNGIQPTEVLRILNEEWGYRTTKRKKIGGVPMASSTWFEILRNPFYCGHFISLGEWHKGIHKPMESEEEYWQLQELLGNKGRPRPSLPADQSYLGMFKCATCGRAITRDDKSQVRCTCKHKYSARHRDNCPKCGLPAKKVPAKRKHDHHYLVCAGRKKPRRGEDKCPEPASKTPDIEEQILSKLSGMEIPQEFIEWAFEALAEQDSEEAETDEEIVRSLENSISDERKRYENRNELYAKGMFKHEGGEEKFDEEQRKSEATIKSLKKKLTKYLNNKVSPATEARAYSFAKNALGWFREGKFRTRSQILNTLDADGKIRDKTLVLDIDAVWIEIENGTTAIRNILPSFEPANFAEFSRLDANQATVAAIKSTWLAASDSNRQPSD
jgi:site-specific DNA recombinase